MKDTGQPVAQGRGAGGQTGRKAAVFAGGIKQKPCVKGAGVVIRIFQDDLVTGQFQIICRLPERQPDERIKPAKGRAKGKEQLGICIAAAQMMQLMAKDQAQLALVIGTYG